MRPLTVSTASDAPPGRRSARSRRASMRSQGEVVREVHADLAEPHGRVQQRAEPRLGLRAQSLGGHARGRIEAAYGREAEYAHSEQEDEDGAAHGPPVSQRPS